MVDKDLNWHLPLVQYGLGAFETMRMVEGRVPLLEFHFERLSKAFKYWSVEQPDLEPCWRYESEKLSKEGEWRLKWLWSLDEKGALFQHLYHFPYQPAKPGLKVVLKTSMSIGPNSFKSCNYAEHFLNNRNAMKDGYDDVIYIDDQQNLVECSRAALVFYKDESWFLNEGGGLQSVCHKALKRKVSDGIESSLCSLYQLDEIKSIWACNALHGLQRIDEIYSDGGQLLFKSDPNHSVDEWNKRLFE